MRMGLESQFSFLQECRNLHSFVVALLSQACVVSVLRRTPPRLVPVVLKWSWRPTNYEYSELWRRENGGNLVTSARNDVEANSTGGSIVERFTTRCTMTATAKTRKLMYIQYSAYSTNSTNPRLTMVFKSSQLGMLPHCPVCKTTGVLFISPLSMPGVTVSVKRHHPKARLARLSAPPTARIKVRRGKSKNGEFWRN